MKKDKIARIEFLTGMYGNAAGDRIWVEEMDDANIYYTDSVGRWCYLEKVLEGVEFKYVVRG